MADHPERLRWLRDIFFTIEEGDLETQTGHVVPIELVITNCPTGSGAAIAKELVSLRLAACVNIIPGVQSYYRWEDELQIDSEETLFIKTPAERLGDLTTKLNELHPHENPELLVLTPDAVSVQYARWVREQTTADS